MRRRRTTASEPEVNADTQDTVAADHTEETPPLPSPEAAAEEAALPKRRRAPRKKAATGEESGAASLTPGNEASQAAPDTPTTDIAPPDGPDAVEKPQRTRRRGTRKTAEAPPAGEPSAEASAPPPVETTPTPVEEATPARPRRARGARKPKAAPEGTPEPEATPAAEDAPAAEPVVPAERTPEAPVTETPPERHRTRGPRRERAVAAAPAEPPPPAYQALPAETLARLALTRITPRKGIPELVVNGEPQLPLLFFANTEDPETRAVAAREIRMAYDAGIRLFTVLAHLPWRARDGSRRYEPLDETLAFVAENAPHGFLLPRLIFSPTTRWEREHPGEMSRYPDGGTGDVSLASRAFWQEEADAALRAAVEHVAQGPHAGRVLGFYLEHGEWFHDYRRGYDYSEPNRLAFRAWLRSRYKNDPIALRAAWYDASVTFENAEIPEWRPPGQLPPTVPLVYGERERRYADFHEYSSDIVAQVITRLGRAVKEASGERAAVAVSYGYTFELPRAGSGHLALASVLQSPDVDILTGPYSYAERQPGGSAPLPAPVESVSLAGKLWISEDDTKTFLARGETPDSYNPPIRSAQDTAAVHARNFAAAITHGAGVSWMDLWGQGWLDDPSLWETIARLRNVSDRLATRRRNPRTKIVPGPDVAVVVDERSFFGVRADERLLGRLVHDQQDVLLRSGARLGFYLLSDLARRNFPETPRLILFLNAFHFPADVRAAIKTRFQRDGRTLAFLYGPGCLEIGGEADGASELGDVVGMHLRLQAWGSKTGTVIVDGRWALTDGRRGQRLGTEERANPSFYAADPRAQVLGEYAGSGNASLAVRKHASWQSVFLGEMSLTPALLRGLYRLAGVPTYTTEDDVAWIGDSLICLHANGGGINTVVLPEEAHLYDLLSGETLARGGRGARLHLRAHELRLLFYGTAAEISRLGGDPSAGPPGLTEAELPPPPQPFVGETREDARRMDAIPEEEDLMAAALVADAPIPDKDVAEDIETPGEAVPEAASEEGVAGRKKRRRRRGRRGRAAETEASADGGDAPGDEDAEPPLPHPGEVTASADAGTSGTNARPADGGRHEQARPAEGASPSRTLPPLSELLPDSELPEGELPPIPDEFLPLEDPEREPLEQPGEPVRARRRGHSRSRRSRRSESAPNGDTPTAEPGSSGGTDAAGENGANDV